LCLCIQHIAAVAIVVAIIIITAVVIFQTILTWHFKAWKSLGAGTIIKQMQVNKISLSQFSGKFVLTLVLLPLMCISLFF